MSPNGYPLFRLTTDSNKYYVPLCIEYALTVSLNALLKTTQMYILR